MKFGVLFPQNAFGDDYSAIKDYTQAAEEFGYDHISANDHVLGVSTRQFRGWKGPFTYKDPFCEVFSLFSYMAAVSIKLEFATSVLILPQRQTALVAKQAASLDRLSGGRFRLGIAIGWNPIEYAALQENFHDRGRRSEEQITVLKKLWEQKLVTYKGNWHDIPEAGINPLPIKRSIPIWLGGSHENVLSRVGTLADGWMPMEKSPKKAEAIMEKIRKYAQQSGRNPNNIGIDARIIYRNHDAADWGNLISGWKSIGATHLTLNTMGAKIRTVKEHIAAIGYFAEKIGIKDV